MDKPKIAILCNNRMAFGPIAALMYTGHLVAVGVPDGNEDIIPYLEYTTQNSAVQFRKFSKQSFKDDVLDFLAECKADAVFIMTFPWLIPAEVLSALPNKTYNFHYGILPGMKGADPIFETIRQKKAESGITIHIATAKIDEGPVVMMRTFPIDTEITHGLLSSSLGQLSANMAMELSKMIEKGTVPQAVPQTGGQYFPRPGINDIKIDWEQMDSSDIHALARACNPWNKGAYCTFGQWNFKIISFSPTNSVTYTNQKAGTVNFGEENQAVFVNCKDQKSLKIEMISTDEGFFPGYRLRSFGLKSGDVLV